MDTKYRIAILLTFISLIIFAVPSYLYSQNNKTEIADTTKSSKNFINFFPDTSLALLVAERLNKTITDNVTTGELSNIKGYFEIGPGDVSSLKGIGFLKGVDSLDCYKNEVTELPDEIGNLSNLKSLDLCKAYGLSKIPSQIGRLKHLKYIRLVLTEVKVIPKEIGNLTELRTLLLSCDSLTEIPKEIGNLKKLVELDIHSNSFKSLPNEICNLTSLRSLDISHCGLESLPENIGNLKHLKTLNLFNNDLRRLPQSINKLDNLSYLNVYDNFKLNESYKKYLPKLLKRH